MSKVRLVSLVFLAIIVAGCDVGNRIFSKDVPSKLRVLVERKIVGAQNENLVVYAMDFRKEGHTLTFTCPCHIAGSHADFINVRVEDDSFKLTTLADADYNVEVQYWTPKADNSK